MTTTTATTTADPGWQLGDSAADAYEAYLVPAIFDHAAQRLVRLAGVKAGDRVLDAACGTAVVARAAAAVAGASGSVTGVDINPQMLATARRVTAGSEPAIELLEADVSSVPLADDAVDVSLVEEALQFVDDPVAVLRELARVTRPGGTVAASVFRSLEHHEVYARLARLLGEHAGAGAEAMMGSPFAFGGADRLRAVAGDAGLVDVRIQIVVGSERFDSVEELLRQEAASSPLAGELATLEPSAWRALVTALEEQLADHVDDLGIAFPNETLVLTARVAG